MKLFNSKTVTILLSTVAILSMSGCKDKGNEGAKSERTLLTEKAPPVAVAEVTPSSVVCPNASTQKVSMDGTKSTDSDGTIVSYEWFVSDGKTDLPIGIGKTLTIPDICAEINDKRGKYQVGLTVEDNDGNRVTDLVDVNILDNLPPVAIAGPDKSINLGETVTLNAGSSHDAEGPIVTYTWNIDGTMTNGVTVTTPSTWSVGDHTVTLTVTDDVGKTGTDSVVITVIDSSNNPPEAKITKPTQNQQFDCFTDGYAKSSPNLGVVIGTRIELVGDQSSDPDGDTLSYAWSGTSKGVQIKSVIANKDVNNTEIIVDDLCKYIEQNSACDTIGYGCKVILNLDVNDGQVSDNAQVEIILNFPT